MTSNCELELQLLIQPDYSLRNGFRSRQLTKSQQKEGEAMPDPDALLGWTSGRSFYTVKARCSVPSH